LKELNPKGFGTLPRLIQEWKRLEGLKYKYTYRECSRGERTAEREYSRDYKPK